MVLKKYFPGVVETSKTSHFEGPDLLYQMQLSDPLCDPENPFKNGPQNRVFSHPE